MKYYIVSHTDLDGLFCIALLKHFYNFNPLVNDDDNHYAVSVDYKIVDHEIQNILTKMKQSDILYITDISINEETAEKIQAVIDEGYIDKCVLLDHHGTALWLNKYNWATVKTEYSNNIKHAGASLLCEYLYGISANHTINYLVELVRLYDTWAWKDPETSKKSSESAKQLQDLFTVSTPDEFVNKMTRTLSFVDVDEAISYLFDNDTMQKINQYNIEVDRKYLSASNNLKHHFINGKHTAWFISLSETSNSIIMSRILEENSDIDWVCCVDLFRNTLEFRTKRDDIDLGKDVAKPLGGGGHPKAAGIPLKDDFYEEIIKTLVDEMSVY